MPTEQEALDRHLRELPEIKRVVETTYAVFADALNQDRLSGASLGFALSRLVYAIVVGGEAGTTPAVARSKLAALVKSVEGQISKLETGEPAP